MDEDVLRARVATACRLIALEGYKDLTLGHVSARNPGDRVIWIKRKGVGLDEVEPYDVIPLDIDDPTAVERDGHHLEAVIHAEIYRARPDVGAVIHGHPLYGTALGATETPLQMLTHDAVLFVDGIGDYDDNPDLIVNQAQGRRVAEALGNRRAAILRNHGVVVSGEDIRWAVLAAITLERAIQFQAIATTLGPLRSISQADAEFLFPRKYPDKFLDEYWSAWERRVHGSRLPEPSAVG